MTRKLILAAALVIGASCLPVSAQGGYAGASYMSSSAEFKTSFQNFDTSSDGWKIYGGFEFDKNFGVEITYYDLGDFSDTQGASTLDAQIWVYDLSLRGRIPLGERFAFTGKLGYSSVIVESEAANNLISVSLDGSDWELFYALGIDLRVGKALGFRAEWESWNVENSLDAVSAGVYFRFGAR
jgi:OOP family OmpA-OmpF porin